MSQPKGAKPNKQPILAIVEARLRKVSGAISASRIRDLIGKDLESDVSISSLETLLEEECGRPHSTICLEKQGALKKFFIGKENIVIEDESERALYKPFAALLERKGFRAQPLDHTRAAKGMIGENHWRYPDIIGYKSGVEQSDMKRLAERTGVQNTDTLVGFELKLELQPGSIRSAFFQCLANSYWANQRYVAAPVIDHEAHEVFRDLSQHFNVGLIEIAWGDRRLRDMENLKIVVECKRSEIDLNALELLRKSWPDLDSFVKNVGH
ncbi:MAG: hypothetical protein K8S54_11540 [Spirochaetia bacterium]|nr:hypothetical protein [Spirochaetia bacterium]